MFAKRAGVPYHPIHHIQPLPSGNLFFVDDAISGRSQKLDTIPLPQFLLPFLIRFLRRSAHIRPQRVTRYENVYHWNVLRAATSHASNTKGFYGSFYQMCYHISFL